MTDPASARSTSTSHREKGPPARAFLVSAERHEAWAEAAAATVDALYPLGVSRSSRSAFFWRAVGRGSLILAEVAAREYEVLPLGYALALTHLYAGKGDRRDEAAALRRVPRPTLSTFFHSCAHAEENSSTKTAGTARVHSRQACSSCSPPRSSPHSARGIDSAGEAVSGEPNLATFRDGTGCGSTSGAPAQ